MLFSDNVTKVHALSEEDCHNYNSVSALPTENDDYNIYLTDDITLTSTWNVPVATTNLCLNEHVINENGGDFSAIFVGECATLNLYDCEVTTSIVHNDM